MILICDNDIVLKLAAFDLLDHVVEQLAGESVLVLEAAKYRLMKPGRQTRKVHSEQTIAKALAFCESAAPLSEVVESEDADALINASYFNSEGQECKIDGGELALFSKAARDPKSYLLSGDKRALYALGKHREVEPHAAIIHQQISGRVVCLERSLELCIDTMSFETVRERVVPNRDCDGVMKLAFSNGMSSQEANVRAAFNSYVGDLEKTVGTDWLWRVQ